MKKISVLIALGMLMIAPWGMAQTIYDGAKLTGKDLNGTARFVGMGGENLDYGDQDFSLITDLK